MAGATLYPPAPPPPPAAESRKRRVGLLALVLLGGTVLVVIVLVGSWLLGGAGPSPSSPVGGPTPTPSTSGSAGSSPTASLPTLLPSGSVAPTGSAVATSPPAVTPTPASATPTPTASPKPSPTPTATATPTPGLSANFKVTPQQVNASCRGGSNALSAFDLTLNNNGSSSAAQWSISFDASPYQGDWGTAKPSSGTLAAGATRNVTITPAADLCGAVNRRTDFTLEVSGATAPITITYRVLP
jgi:hypothetical protein